MPLSREEILASADRPITEAEAPEFGGTLLIRAVSMADERFQAYINAPVLRPADPDAELASLLKAPPDATAKEKAAWRNANALVGRALSRQYTEPTPDERALRVQTAVFILGVVDVDGNQLYKWSDATKLRSGELAPWAGVVAVADKIVDLSQAIPLEESKSGAPG